MKNLRGGKKKPGHPRTDSSVNWCWIETSEGRWCGDLGRHVHTQFVCVNDDCVHGYWVQKTYDPFNKKTLTAMCFFNVISEYLTKLMK